MQAFITQRQASFQPLLRPETPITIDRFCEISRHAHFERSLASIVNESHNRGKEHGFEVYTKPDSGHPRFSMVKGKRTWRTMEFDSPSDTSSRIASQPWEARIVFNFTHSHGPVEYLMPNKTDLLALDRDSRFNGMMAEKYGLQASHNGVSLDKYGLQAFHIEVSLYNPRMSPIHLICQTGDDVVRILAFQDNPKPMDKSYLKTINALDKKLTDTKNQGDVIKVLRKYGYSVGVVDAFRVTSRNGRVGYRISGDQLLRLRDEFSIRLTYP